MIAYYRKTLGVMGAVLVVAVGSAVYSNGWAERERADFDASVEIARVADAKAGKAEKAVRECTAQMVPVERFLQSWKAYLPAPGRAGELAMVLRSMLEDAAQKKLGLVVDNGQTPEAYQYALGRRNYRVQSITMRASGGELGKLLVWLGEVEKTHALGRVEDWELTGGDKMTALKITLLQPLAEIPLTPSEPRANSFAEVGTPESWTNYLPDRVKQPHGVKLVRNPLQPMTVANSTQLPLAPEKDEWSPKLQQALARKVRSIVRGTKPMVMIGERMFSIGEEIVVGPKADPVLPSVIVRLVAVSKEELVFLVDSVRADKPFQVTAKYKLEKFLISK
jgi:hypothetical protein